MLPVCHGLSAALLHISFTLGARWWSSLYQEHCCSRGGGEGSPLHNRTQALKSSVHSFSLPVIGLSRTHEFN